MKKITVALFIVGLLTGCTTENLPNSITPDLNRSTDDASIKLAEAARSVSQSLNELKEIEKASNPPIKALPYPTASGLENIIASVDWSGPIEPLLQRIAKLTQYQLEIIGKQPAVPILVTISSQNTPLGYIIRDANFQAGIKANIVVYPGIKTIELRYAKS